LDGHFIDENTTSFSVLLNTFFICFFDQLVINKNILNVELKDTNKSLQKKIETKTKNEEHIKPIHVPEINLQKKDMLEVNGSILTNICL
jgi:hypothetical protein